ncbi:hypothetical protein Y032_1102g3606, partial [Ancylostoma ceylanicum]
CHIYGGSTCPPPRTVILSFCVLVPAFQKNSLFMNPEVIPAENGVAYEDLHRGLPSSAQSGPSTGSSNGMELRVLTLNVWCLPQPWPIGSKDRKFRLKKLAEAILDENLDIVGLQEVWSETDYLDMVDRLSGSFRFNHYFHSGFTGSGVCVFSRHPIVSTLTHRYSLNGFAHHIHRGDWFGGKVISCEEENKVFTSLSNFDKVTIWKIEEAERSSIFMFLANRMGPSTSKSIRICSQLFMPSNYYVVGLVELEVGEIRVNFYTTHLHAEYDRENDLYLPHRTSQSFELSQFIRHTAHGADVVIVTGDLNMEPDDLGFSHIIIHCDVSVVRPRDESSDTRNASRGAYIFEKLIFEANGPIERWHALFPSSR